MLALCLTLLVTHYALKYAGIIGLGLNYLVELDFDGTMHIISLIFCLNSDQSSLISESTEYLDTKVELNSWMSFLMVSKSALSQTEINCSLCWLFMIDGRVQIDVHSIYLQHRYIQYKCYCIYVYRVNKDTLVLWCTDVKMY